MIKDHSLDSKWTSPYGDETSVTWSDKGEAISIEIPHVHSHTGDLHHDYRVTLTLGDLFAIFDALTEHLNNSSDPKLLKRELKKKMGSVTSLLAAIYTK